MTGRGWAYIGTALGGVASVSANVAHSYLPPAGAPHEWHPEPGAVAFAVFWPVALYVVVEILVKSTWPAGRGWMVGRCVLLLPVALVAFVVSYRHLSGLLRHYHDDPLTVAIGPLGVDGLMVMAAAALFVARTTPAEPDTAPVLDQVPVPAPQTSPDAVPVPDVTTLPLPAPRTNGAIPSGVVR